MLEVTATDVPAKLDVPNNGSWPPTAIVEIDHPLGASDTKTGPVPVHVAEVGDVRRQHGATGYR